MTAKQCCVDDLLYLLTVDSGGPSPLPYGLSYLEESTPQSSSHPGVLARLVTILQGQHITADILEVSEREREREGLSNQHDKARN